MSDAGIMRLRPDVTLSPLTPDHAPAMFRWMCDPVVRDNVGVRAEPSMERTHAWIRAALADPAVKAFAVLAGGRHVGNVVIDRVDRALGTGRLSAYIGEASARGKGVGRTAIYLALREAFEGIALHKVWLIVHPGNAPAIRTYRRLGFSVEGTLRDEFILAGRRVAALYMGMLEPEFRNIKVEMGVAEGRA